MAETTTNPPRLNTRADEWDDGEDEFSESDLPDAESLAQSVENALEPPIWNGKGRVLTVEDITEWFRGNGLPVPKGEDLLFADDLFATYLEAGVEPTDELRIGGNRRNPRTGRPLALQGETKEQRDFQRAVRDVYTPDRESHELWQAQAENLFGTTQAQHTAAARLLLEMAERGEMPTAMHQKLIPIVTGWLIRSDNDGEGDESGRGFKLAAIIQGWGERVASTETARALVARRDPKETPAQRNAAFLRDSYERQRAGSAPALSYDIFRLNRDLRRVEQEAEAAEAAGDTVAAASLNSRADEIRAEIARAKTSQTRVKAAQQKQREALKKAGLLVSDFDGTDPEIARKKAANLAEKDESFRRARERAILANRPKEMRGSPADILRESPVDLGGNPAQVSGIAQLLDIAAARGADMFREYYVNAILSGIKTSVVNISGNTANIFYEHGLRKLVEASANAFLRAFSLGKLGSKNAARFGEFSHMLRSVLSINYLEKFADAWRANRPMFAEQYLAINIEAEAIGVAEKGFKAALPGRFGKIVRSVGRLLMATDEAFKWLAASAEAASRAYRLGKIQGLKGEKLKEFIQSEINDPASASRKIAAIKAVEDTFQKRWHGTHLGKVLEAANRVREIPFAGVLIIPFTTTPFNIMIQGLRKSPAGTLNMLSKALRHGLFKATGGRHGKEYAGDLAMSHLAEQLIAWTGAAILFGAISGDEDDNKKGLLITGSFRDLTPAQRAHYYRLGLRPYSIRWGGENGTTIDYSRLEPLATSLGVIADVVTGAKRAKEDGRELAVFEKVRQSVLSQAKNKTFLQGLSRFIDAADDSGERASGFARNYLAGTIASFVPNLLRQAARETDPVLRPRSQTFLGQVEGNVWSRSQPADIDLYGREKLKSQPGSVGSYLRVLNPFASTQINSVNKADRVLFAWNQRHRDDPNERWHPQTPSKTVIFRGKKYSLNDEQLNEYRRAVGAVFVRRLNASYLGNEARPRQQDIDNIKGALTRSRIQVNERLSKKWTLVK